MRPSWDDYFLSICDVVATRADCVRAKHGALIVIDCRIISSGYNGSPAGGPSCLMGECPRGLLTEEELAHNSSDYSNCKSLHAEQNAIAYAHRDLRNATIYLVGGKPPCDMCDKLIKAVGITRVLWR